ncbi:MAG: nitroreductase family deazaflavin-dependent oxidoreductase [Anaerolineaceae bacterium]|nr:nitroreductase family deazaflavin-dependent oxidoreductase [Anaerolineaceae bacterium]
MAKKRVVPLWFNKVTKLVLRTPLIHRVVSHNIMLLTYTGRKTGKVYTIPVSYTKHGNAVTMFTNHNWSKNLIDKVPVTLRLQGRQLEAALDFITTDVEQITPVLLEHLRNKPADARIHKVTYDDTGKPKADEVRRAAGNVRMIMLRLV